MRKSLLLTLLLLSFCSGLLSGCGQTGALYLPEDSAEQASEATPNTDSPKSASLQSRPE